MPIQRCQGSGWKWGKHGKCYRGKGSRQKAIRQMRAIFRSGYKG